MDGVVHASGTKARRKAGRCRRCWPTCCSTKWIKELERRGHRFVRYADDCNVYVRSQRAGERVMGCCGAAMRELHLKVNESQERGGSACGAASSWATASGWPGTARSSGAVAEKALADVQAAGPGTDASRNRAAAWSRSCERAAGLCAGLEGLLPAWRKRRRSCASWTSGCATGCGRSSSSTGRRGKTILPGTDGARGERDRWPEGGGQLPSLVAQQPHAPQPCADRSPTSTGWACLASHDLNFSNRPVRTRMPGGVAGARS